MYHVSTPEPTLQWLNLERHKWHFAYRRARGGRKARGNREFGFTSHLLEEVEERYFTTGNWFSPILHPPQRHLTHFPKLFQTMPPITEVAHRCRCWGPCYSEAAGLLRPDVLMPSSALVHSDHTAGAYCGSTPDALLLDITPLLQLSKPGEKKKRHS